MTKLTRYEIGTRSGIQTVTGIAPSRAKHCFYTVACDCGSVREVRHQDIMKTASCGCVKKRTFTCTRHGLSKTKLYRLWQNMRDRVERNPSYADVTICREWDDVRAFYQWAKANGYKDGLSLDRIENAKVYSPATCHWVTRLDQTRNRDCVLPQETVEAIRIAAHYTDARVRGISNGFDLANGTVSNIVRGVNWKGVGIDLTRPHLATDDHDLSWFLEGLVVNENAPIDPRNTFDTPLPKVAA